MNESKNIAVLEPQEKSPAKRWAKFARERQLRLIDIWFTELGGRPWRLTLNAENLDDRMFAHGVVVDGRQVGGTWHGHIALVPDPSHGFIDPVASVPTLALICDVRKASGDAYAEDPRSVLTRAIARFHQARPGWLWNVGIELEFFLTEHGQAAPNAVVREVVREAWENLASAGIAVDWFRIGPPDGLGRVQMRAADALRTADQAVIYKHVVSQLSKKRGFTARFLAKPLAGSGSASMLVHHALWNAGENRFFDAGGWQQTSALCRSFAAGLLQHAPALMAFCAPTVNSYRRLGPDDGPIDPMISLSASSAACRIPAGTTGSSPASRRVKFCCADPAANPYLALSAMILAGLAGIDSAQEAQPDERFEVAMPRSLEEALDALRQDAEFLTRDGVFPKALIEAWIDDRRRSQIESLRPWPHPKELELDRED